MFHYFFGEQKWWVIEGWWNGNGLTFGKVWLRLCRCVFRKSCTLSQILLGAEIENFAWMADRNGQPDMDIDIANRTFLSSVPMKKGTCFFSKGERTNFVGWFLREESARQWVQWRMTSTNHATSQRIPFRSQVAFVDVFVFVDLFFFFWWQIWVSHDFLFFQWKTHKNRSPKSSSIRKKRKHLHRKTGKNPACRRLMPNCRSQWIKTEPRIFNPARLRVFVSAYVLEFC